MCNKSKKRKNTISMKVLKITSVKMKRIIIKIAIQIKLTNKRNLKLIEEEFM